VTVTGASAGSSFSGATPTCQGQDSLGGGTRRSDMTGSATAAGVTRDRGLRPAERGLGMESSAVEEHHTAVLRFTRRYPFGETRLEDGRF
jgi:hypothetical protein